MWQIYLGLLLLAGVFGAAVSLYALLQRDTPGAAPLALLMLGAALWSIAEGISLAGDGVGVTLFWAKLRLSLSAVIPLAWLLTTVEYTGTDRALDTRYLLALVVEPLLFVGLVWTNGLHGLVWPDIQLELIGGYTAPVTSFGVVFLGHVAYSYLLIAVGAFLLARLLFRSEALFRAQITAMLAAIAVPLLANASYLFGVAPRGIDPTGVAFVVTGAFVTGAILRRQLLSVTAGTREIGRDEVVAELDDPVFIVDADGAIADHNGAAADLIDVTGHAAIGEELGAVMPTLATAIDGDDDGAERTTTIEHDGSVRTYDLQVSRIERQFGPAGGQIISLRDVTARTRREQQLDVLNRLLRHNIRNEMNVVRGQAELLAETLDRPDRLERVARIVETVDTVTERSDKVGTLTRAFDAEEPTVIDLSIVLRDAIDAVERPHPDADIRLQGEADVSVRGAVSLGVAFEELLTNAVEHHDGERPMVEVAVEPSGDSVTVTVNDDGPGIDAHEASVIERGRETALEHGSGIGLWLVAWIVRTFGGTITFADADVGTTVVVRLPRATTDDDPATAS